MLARLESCVPYLPWLWLIGTPLTFLLLATGLIGSERLRRASRVIDDGPIADAAARLLHTLQISRRVTVAVCERIAAPVLVGIVRPIILLPPAALTGWSPDEIEMVLLHELAHVRRWDNLVNLAQRCLESLLFFHPAVWLVSNWVRRERETCCDAVVVARTNRPHAYAEMLVALAAQMPRSVLFHPAASSAMAAGPLRARIRHILQLEEDPMLVSGKSFAMVLGSVVLAATLAVLYLPTLGQAEESTSEKSATAESTTEELTTEGTKSTKQTRQDVNQAESETQDSATVNRDADGKTSPAESLPLMFSLKRNDEGHPQLYLNQKPLMFTQGRELGKPGLAQKEEIGVRVLFERGLPAVDQPVSLSAGKELTDKEVSRTVDSLRAVGFKKISVDTRDVEARDGDLNQAESLTHDSATVERDTNAVTDANDSSPWAFSLKRNEKGEPVLYLNEKPIDEAGVRNLIKDQTQSADDRPVSLSADKGMSYSEVIKVVDLLQASGFKKLALDTRHVEARDGHVQLESNKRPPDNWPMGVVFPSPAEGEISRRAWEKLGLKLVPATKEELNQAGASQGVKVIEGIPIPISEVPGKPNPLILVDINNTPLREFGDIQKAVDALEKEPKPIVKFVLSSNHQNFVVSKMGTNFATEKVDSISEQQVESKPRNSKFPSLEDQKLADLAWKRLGIELEQISGEDLKRVQALGYEGGLKVTSLEMKLNQLRQQGDNRILQKDDILVGLHVWPTTNLPQVIEVLNREDLAEINPLKFYVVRFGKPVPSGGGFGGRAASPEVDTVVTGRIAVESVSMPKRSLLLGAPPTQENSTSPRPTPAHTVPTNSSAGTPTPQSAPLGPTVAPSPYSRPAPSPAPVTADSYAAPTPADSSVGTSQPQYVPATEPQSSVAKVLPGTPRATRVPRSETTVVPEPAEEDETEESVLVPTRTPANGSPYQAPAHPPVPSSLALVQDPVQPLTPSPPQPPLASAVPPPPAQGNAQLRYDGKTFDDWSNAWRTELSTEKRLEAVKALAAFGRAGYGKEAAETILDVAGEYDFSILQGSENKEGKLQETVIDQLAPREYRGQLLAQYWVPDLARRLEKEPKKWQGLAYWLLARLKTDDPSAIAILQSLAQNGPGEVRSAALEALVRSNKSRDGAPRFDDKTRELVVASLKSEDLNAVRSGLILLVSYPLPEQEPRLIFLPELVPLLFHEDEGVQKQARLSLRSIGEKDASPVVQELMGVLNDVSRRANHIEAIRALAVMGPKAQSAVPNLHKILASSDADNPLRYAALVALDSIDNSGYQKALVEALGQELEIEVDKNGQIGWRSMPKSKVFQAGYDAESKQLIPPQGASQTGGGIF